MEMRIQVGSGLPACRGALWARFCPARRAEARRQPRRADPTWAFNGAVPLPQKLFQSSRAGRNRHLHARTVASHLGGLQHAREIGVARARSR